MPKSEYQFADFLMNVDDRYKDFVITVHEMLAANYKAKIELKASGFLVSYIHNKTKRSILNFVFRKNGIYIRIYGENCNDYVNVLNRLPNNIVKQIEGAGVCKRLVDPGACNSKCGMGYDFHIGDNHYQKCRNSCFYLYVDDESIPHLLELVESESRSR